MPRRPFPSLRFLFAAAVLIAILAFARALWLPALAGPLILDSGPARAEIAVVLAGDWWGNRILKGGDLVRRGFVPVVLVSGPDGFYGHYESDLAIPFAVERGCPREWFAPFPNRARSTLDEARAVVAELQRRGTRGFLLVTSDYHTARAGRTFRKVMRDAGLAADMRVVAAPDQFFHRDGWWRDREGRKIVFLEWCKTAAAVFGM